MKAKQIILPLGYSTDDMSAAEVREILKADGVIHHHRKAAKPFIPTVVNLTTGEWAIRMFVDKAQLIDVMAKIMAGEGGPSVNMDEVAELADEVWTSN